MTNRPLTLDSITEQLYHQLRRRISGWAYLLIPLLFVCVIIILWVLMLVFGGELAPEPAPLLISAAILTAGILFGISGYQRITSKTIRRHPLMQQGPGALDKIQQIVITATTQSEIISVLHAQIQTVLEPQYMDTALYDRKSHTFHLTESKHSITAEDSFLTWLSTQPVNLLYHLPEASAPSETQATQDHLLTWGMHTLLPLGTQGWLGIGKPENKKAFSSADFSMLQLLCQPVGIGLERIALLESQKERAEELQAIHLMTQAVNISVELDDLFELIYTQLNRVIDLQHFTIALINQQNGQLVSVFSIKNHQRVYEQVTLDQEAGLINVLLKNKVTIRTNDYCLECHRQAIQPADEDKASQAWMGTALTAGEVNLGVMVASYSDPDKVFAPEDQNFFVTVASYTSSILDRKTLHKQLQARAEQLDSLVAVSQLLASSLELNIVLDIVVGNAAQLLNSEAGSLLLLDEKSGDLIFQSSSGPSSSSLVGMRVPAGKGIAGAAFTENHPIISQDTQSDNRWYANFDDRSEFTTHSILAVPLNARGRTIGVLEVINRKDAKPFDSQDSDLLLSFASQAAIAIENARLFTSTDQALQARLEELMTIQYIDRQLNATLDYPQVMNQTLDWALRITHATIGLVCAVIETDSGEQGLRFLTHKGYDEEDFKRYSHDNVWPLHQGLLGHTVSLGETLLEQNVQNNPHYVELVPGMQAQLTVPIKREERVIGAIVMESKEAESFTDDNVAFVQRLADHAAIAIDNARLFQQVQQANAAKTQFVSFVSHELKQPMASIKSYCDLLQKNESAVLADKQLEFVNYIQSSADRMNHLIQDLLDISRIESGQMRLTMAAVNPGDIANLAIQNFQHMLDSKKQRLHVDIAPGLPIVKADKGRLSQVLDNLVSNAHKYTPEGGSITIRVSASTQKGRDVVRWSVTDTGIGMSQEELDSIFTKYFRAEQAIVRNNPGTGLGLVISQYIVELHGGTMSVESVYQKGSTFSFTVPVVKP